MSQQKENQMEVEVKPSWKTWVVTIGPRGGRTYIREDTEYEVVIQNPPVQIDNKEFTFRVEYKEVEFDQYREVECEERIILSKVKEMIKLALEYAKEKGVNNVNIIVLDSRPKYNDC